MYRILHIESGEYLYYMEPNFNYQLFSFEEIIKYEETVFKIAEFSSKEKILNIFYNSDCHAVYICGENTALTSDILPLFEIVEV